MLFSANRKSELIMIFAFLLYFVLAFVCSPKIKNKDGSLHFFNLLFFYAMTVVRLLGEGAALCILTR